LDNLDEATLKRIKEALKSMGAEADNAEDFVDKLRNAIGKIGDTEKDINRATKEMEELKD
jgi:ABC-type transporter Mla subunit MlaD